MKAWEMLEEENVGKKYTDEYGIIYRVERIKNNGKEYIGIVDLDQFLLLTTLCCLSEIKEKDFEEIVDWNEVKKDTRILVSEDGNIWERRFFAKYSHNKVFAWDYGTTSFTGKRSSPWKYAKLYNEEDE